METLNTVKQVKKETEKQLLFELSELNLTDEDILSKVRHYKNAFADVKQAEYMIIERFLSKSESYVINKLQRIVSLNENNIKFFL